MQHKLRRRPEASNPMIVEVAVVAEVARMTETQIQTIIT